MFRLFRTIALAVVPLFAAIGVHSAFAQDELAQCAIQGPFEPQQQAAEGSGGDFCTCCDPCCCLWTSPTLTGDWCGIRPCLQESGVIFAGRSTHFGFGVNGGITAPVVPPSFLPGNTFAYTGCGEYDLLFDLEKFGGLPKGKLLFRLEHWYGQYGNVSLARSEPRIGRSISPRSGATSPPASARFRIGRPS